MAQMNLPTAEQKAKQVAKAKRHVDSLQGRYDRAKEIVDQVKPDLDKAQKYLTYLEGMPVSDADPTQEQASDSTEDPAQPSLFDEQQHVEEPVFG